MVQPLVKSIGMDLDKALKDNNCESDEVDVASAMSEAMNKNARKLAAAAFRIIWHHEENKRWIAIVYQQQRKFESIRKRKYGKHRSKR